MQDLHNYKARPHLYPGISGEISSALSLATCRWRLSIARAQAAARLFLKEGREKPLALLLPSYSHPKKDPWNVACSLASKIHHIGPNFVFFPLSFCVSLLAGRLSCTYSFCQDDTPSLFEATLSTRQEDRDSWNAFLDFTAALHQEIQKSRWCQGFCLFLFSLLPKNMGVEWWVCVCFLCLPQCSATGLEKWGRHHADCC